MRNNLVLPLQCHIPCTWPSQLLPFGTHIQYTSLLELLFQGPPSGTVYDLNSSLPKRPGQIRDIWSQGHLSNVVGHSRGKLPVQIPAIDSSIRMVSGSSHYVTPSLLLFLNKLRNEFGLKL